MLNNLQIERLHNEINDAVRPILDKYDLEMLPSCLRYGVDSVNLPIKAISKINANSPNLIPASDVALKAGYASIGTTAFVTDRNGKKRPVVITGVKQKKYMFYFSDTDASSRQFMVGHFALFTSVS